MHTYSFRAECVEDVVKFIRLLLLISTSNLDITISPLVKNLPDVAVKLETPLSIEKLVNLLEEVEDSHVIIRTLTEEYA